MIVVKSVIVLVKTGAYVSVTMMSDEHGAGEVVKVDDDEGNEVVKLEKLEKLE